MGNLAVLRSWNHGLDVDGGVLEYQERNAAKILSGGNINPRNCPTPPGKLWTDVAEGPRGIIQGDSIWLNIERYEKSPVT